jgi:hypothetical protein
MLADSSPGVIFSYQDILGRYGVFKEISQNLDRVFGLSAAAVMENSIHFFNFIGPLNTALFQQQIRQSFVYKKTVSFELCVSLTPDSSRWFNCQFSPNLDQGHLHGIGFLANSSETHAKIKQLEDQIWLIEKMHDAMPDKFYYKDAHSGFLGGNKAWKDFHHISDMRQWIGKTDKDSPVFDSDVGEHLFLEEQSFLQEGKTIRVREIVADQNGDTQFDESIKTPVYDRFGGHHARYYRTSKR